MEGQQNVKTVVKVGRKDKIKNKRTKVKKKPKLLESDVFDSDSDDANFKETRSSAPPVQTTNDSSTKLPSKSNKILNYLKSSPVTSSDSASTELLTNDFDDIRADASINRKKSSKLVASRLQDAKNTKEGKTVLKKHTTQQNLNQLFRLKTDVCKKTKENGVSNSNSQSSLDAFQVMMEARKKSIGMNSPGKEVVHTEPKDLSAQKEMKAKRALYLAKWADHKGAGKRKESEELKDQQIKNELDKREKHLKKMLLKGPKTPKRKTAEEKMKEGIEDFKEIFSNGKTGKKSSKRKRTLEVKAECNDETIKKTKLQKGSAAKSESLANCIQDEKPSDVSGKPSSATGLETKRQIKSEMSPDSAEDNFFLSQLCLSLKKRESMLSYFEKKKLDSDATHQSSESTQRESKNSPSDIVTVNQKIKSKKSMAINKKNKIINNSSTEYFDSESDRPNKKDISKNNTKQSNERVDNIDVSCKNKTKMRRKKRASKSELSENKDLAIFDDSVNNIQDKHTKVLDCNTSERPRRSSKKPIRYIQESSNDSEESRDLEDLHIFTPKSKKKAVSRKKCKQVNNKENVVTIEIDDKVSPLKIINLQSPGKMACIRSPRTPEILTDKKLAPLFRKNILKPKIDPTVLEARKNFLQSGVPESIKRHFDKPSSVLYDFDQFPSVCHIQQISNELEKQLSNLDSSLHLFKTPDPSLLDDINATLSFDRELLDLSVNCSESWISTYNLLENHSLKDGLKEIKRLYPQFPVYKVFHQLNYKFQSTSKNPNPSEVVSVCEKSADGILHVDADYLLWTEKYKPLSSNEILGNSRSVASIKRWLETWKEYNETSANRLNKRVRRSSDSSCDFDISDSESRESSRIPDNMMLVTGPPGSGKTSCIYAIANELGINVLEVNASSKRTGRKILSELHEATQSHKVVTKPNSESAFNLFRKQENHSSNSKNNTKLRDTISSDAFKKVKPSSQSSVTSHEEDNSQKMSLMLIEDADIVFEEDDGFVGALLQLVQSSKRPVLIVTSDDECGHLQRFVTNNNLIRFRPLLGETLGPWLDVLLLIECKKILSNLSRSVIEFYKGDIRLSLHQLQYWILGSRTTKKNEEVVGHHDKYREYNNISPCSSEGWLEDNVAITNNDDTWINVTKNSDTIVKTKLLSELSHVCNLELLWWNSLNVNIGISSNSANKQEGTSTETEIEGRQQNMLETFEFLDCLSYIDTMQSVGKCTTSSRLIKPPWKQNLKDGLSETEDFSSYDRFADLSSTLCQYVMDKISKISIDDKNFCNNFNGSLNLRSSTSSTYEQLSMAIPPGAILDRNGVVLDYLPALRHICRSEKIRSENNLKRNNRFYHYMTSLSVDVKENILNLACTDLKL